MKPLRKTILFVAALLLISSAVFAQGIYRYIDEKGNIQFTDTPKAGWTKVEANNVMARSPKPKNGVRVVAFVASDTPYANLINKAASRYSLDGNLIKAVIQVESSFNPNAVSHAAAKGLMQMIDSTAAMYKVKNIFNPAEAIDAGSHHLMDLLNVYDGNLKLALAAYNAGNGAVRKYGGVPPYKETRRYIQKIAAIYGKMDSSISDAELATSYVAARALARGDRFIYRYKTPNGLAYSDHPPTGKAYIKVDLFKRKNS